MCRVPVSTSWPPGAMRNTYLVCYDISDDKRLRARPQDDARLRRPPAVLGLRVPVHADRPRLAAGTRSSEIINHRHDQVLFVDLGPAEGRGDRVITALGKPYAPDRRALHRRRRRRDELTGRSPGRDSRTARIPHDRPPRSIAGPAPSPPRRTPRRSSCPTTCPPGCSTSSSTARGSSSTSGWRACSRTAPTRSKGAQRHEKLDEPRTSSPPAARMPADERIHSRSVTAVQRDARPDRQDRSGRRRGRRVSPVDYKRGRPKRRRRGPGRVAGRSRAGVRAGAGAPGQRLPLRRGRLSTTTPRSSASACRSMTRWSAETPPR